MALTRTKARFRRRRLIGVGKAQVFSERGSPLPHLDARGEAIMVDVGHKDETLRRAVAEAMVSVSVGSLASLREGTVAKGDALAVARIAGIQAAKRTSELVPLCHPIPLTRVEVHLELIDRPRPSVHIVATTETRGRTGVEIEALNAASVAALTLYDMLKAIDRRITWEVRLLEKHGGRTGSWMRSGAMR